MRGSSEDCDIRSEEYQVRPAPVVRAANGTEMRETPGRRGELLGQARNWRKQTQDKRDNKIWEMRSGYGDK